MRNKNYASKLSKLDAENLSKWEDAISEVKKRISVLRRSLKTFELLRDSGAEFPEPKNMLPNNSESCPTKKSKKELLGKALRVGLA